jgi:hypothetical protein
VAKQSENPDIKADSGKGDPFRAAATVAALVLLATSPLALWKLAPIFSDNPLEGILLAAAIFGLATTPLAYAVLGRMNWFQARRGRVYQRPEFWSICAGMAMVMAIPAIFAVIVQHSSHYDKSRYEFDPNKTISVLDQGRSYETLKTADEGIRKQEQYLDEQRKNLVNNVKKLDEAMLTLRAVAGTSPAVAQTIPDVLQRLAGVRRSIGLDAPQQLMDFTAPPADIRGTALASNNVSANAITANLPPAALPNIPAPVAPPAAGALSTAVVETELATVPDPQKPLAAMLPLADVPPGWVVGKSGTKHLETFNADNLFEKIDGRAESFIQYDVRGMAYTYYHPAGDESNEVQVYIFEMASSLKALGKFGSEKPESVKPVQVGSEGYSAAGSTLFYSGPYYTQIVSTKDDAKFADFALELAKRIVAKQKPDAAVAGTQAISSPESLFAILPAGQGRAEPKYIPQDVFGYSFLSEVFMVDYKDGSATWQGFVRPYPTPEAAKAIFEKYTATIKQDGATIKTPTVEGADQFAIVANVGLTDAIFRKGNIIAGANGGTDAAKAEAFARTFLKALPASLPPLETDLPGKAGDKPKAKAQDPEGEGSDK